MMIKPLWLQKVMSHIVLVYTKDALPFFNQCIEKVQIYSKSNTLKHTIVFTESNPSSYLVTFDINLTAPTFLYLSQRGHVFSKVIEGDQYFYTGDAKNAMKCFQVFLDQPHKDILTVSIGAEIYYKMACCAHATGNYPEADFNFRVCIEGIKQILEEDLATSTIFDINCLSSRI